MLFVFSCFCDQEKWEGRKPLDEFLRPCIGCTRCGFETVWKVDSREMQKAETRFKMFSSQVLPAKKF